MVSACAVTDIDAGSTTENPSIATTTPGSTPTPRPTPAPTPIEGPKPGLNRNDAVAIRLGETVESRFSILYPDLHYYKVQAEEGTTYTVDITNTLGKSSVRISDSDIFSEALARNTDSEGNRVSRIVWTAPRSGTYFVTVFGSSDNRYTLTMTGGPPKANPTETPISLSASTVPPFIAYEDNFNDPNSGWGEGRNESVEGGYLGGEYRMLVKATNWFMRRNETPSYSDFDARVRARYEGGTLTKSYGLIFRFVDGDNFYVFEINPSSGKYQFRKREGGTWAKVIDWTPSSHINLGTTTNVLRVIGRGSRFELYVNSQFLEPAVDQTFTVGRIGLLASNGEDPNGVEIFFDDLSVREPAPLSPPTIAGSTPQTPTEALVASSETCRAVVPPDDAIQECSVEAIGPGRFTASIRAGGDEGFGWRVQVNAARRLPEEVVCNRTQGVGDGDVTCEVPEGVSTKVEIGGQSKGKVGGGTPAEITIDVKFVQYAAPPEPKLLAHSAICGTDKPLRTAQRCSVHAIGPGKFTASVRTGRDVGFRWQVQVNDARRLPDGVVCNRTQGVGDGDVTCEVPEGTRTEVEISGTLLNDYGRANSNEIAIKTDFLQYAASPGPKRLDHSAVCGAVVAPATHQRCSVHAIGPGTFHAFIRTGGDDRYDWRVQVNDARRLPDGVVCNRTEGEGDGEITCDVPEGTRTEVEISGQLRSGGSGLPAEITIQVDFLQ